MTPDELTELEALERAATPSEKWEVGGPYPGVTVIRCIDAGAGWPDPSPPEYECLFELWPTTQGEAPLDVHALAALMVALRNAAPRLFAALREAWAANKLYEAERYGLQAEVDRLRADITAALNERDALKAENERLETAYTRMANTAADYKAEVETLKAKWADALPKTDQPLPEDDQIQAAFPTRSGRHDLFAEAMRLVGAKFTKAALVSLVNWQLHESDRLQGNFSCAAQERDALRAEVERLTKERNTARRLAAQREGYQTQNERLRGLLKRCRWAADSFKGNEGLWADLDAALEGK